MMEPTGMIDAYNSMINSKEHGLSSKTITVAPTAGCAWGRPVWLTGTWSEGRSHETVRLWQ